MSVKFFSGIFLLLFTWSCKKEPFKWTSEYDISVMSFNIRYDTEEDGVHKWSNRKEAIIKMWQATSPSIVGIQEGLQHQVDFLDKNLPAYEYVGVGRDDGHNAGEYAAIYYRSDDFQLLESNTFWLSETPDVPSRGWDANNIRIATWAHFKDLQHDRTFYVFNTHFDHKGAKARLESAKLLVEKAKEIVPDDNIPVFLIGDFNAWISNDLFEPINNEYLDARRFAAHTDHKKSFNLWGKWYANWSVDYIFYKHAEALAFRTVIENYDVPYISDHYPVITHFNYFQ